MKVAITGHSAGIGQALAKLYNTNGHEIVGLSKRNGYNIRNIPKILTMVESCDLFVNNAQAGFSQTELLFAVYKMWRGQKNKKIINISTMMTMSPVSTLPGLDMMEYRVQKIALEEAHRQLAYLNDWPKLILIKPGAIATQPNQISPRPYADVDAWANKIFNLLDLGPDLEVSEIAVGVNYP